MNDLYISLKNEILASRFTLLDYIVFCASLAVSAAIGIYHACVNQQTTDEFLMGGRSMGAFPVSLSLLGSFMSAITLLGVPAEMVNYGIGYWWECAALSVVVLVTATCYLPVFYSLETSSVYEMSFLDVTQKQTDMVNQNRFGVLDYSVLGSCLILPATIGIYYARVNKKTTEEFLMGGRTMSIAPVAFSLLASFMSSIALLGQPAEVYVFGVPYWLSCIPYATSVAISSTLYLPVFYNLGITSAYEYLERRFSKGIRKCGSLIFIIQMTIYMAIVLYAPALALSQVTGLHVWGSVVAIGTVCTFYTTLGGMKAVMWTDAFQIFIMFGAMITVVVKGCIDLGGIDFVWQKSLEGERLQFFDFSPSPLVRHSFWSLTVGGTFTWLAVYGVNQAQVQRYLTTPTIKTAQIALWFNLFGLIALLSVCCLAGLVIYATYWNCDPLTTKQIDLSDQLLPLFVMDTLGSLPGLPGLFVAGIFSGALSTVSSGMNSLAAVTLEDFVRAYSPDMSESKATVISKILAFSYGVLCIALVAVAEQLGNVLQAALSIFGIVGGPLLGVFTLGIFFPCANSIGAAVGLICGFALSFWIGVGAQVYRTSIYLPKAPVSISGCEWTNNSWVNDTLTLVTELLPNATFANETLIPEMPTPLEEISTVSALLPGIQTTADDDDVWAVYKISYLWYSFIACWTVIIIGLIVSLITGRQDPETLDPLLICPIFEKICCCLPERARNCLRCGVKEMPASPGIAMDSLKNGIGPNGIDKIGIDNPVFNGNDTTLAKNNHEYITPL